MTDPARRDVDARFLLANDRTLLAWIRTALTLLAAGVGVLQLATGDARVVPGVTLLVLGTASAMAGLLRHRSADRSMRAGELPDTGRTPYAIGWAVVALSAVLVVVALAGGLSG